MMFKSLTSGLMFVNRYFTDNGDMITYLGLLIISILPIPKLSLKVVAISINLCSNFGKVAVAHFVLLSVCCRTCFPSFLTYCYHYL